MAAVKCRGFVYLVSCFQESKDSPFDMKETIESLNHKQQEELWTNLNQLCTTTLLGLAAEEDDEEGQEVLDSFTPPQTRLFCPSCMLAIRGESQVPSVQKCCVTQCDHQKQGCALNTCCAQIIVDRKPT